MPNRILREGMRRSRKLAAVSAEGHRMFTSLLTYADDYGRFDADPVIVRAECFPRSLDKISVEDVARWLEEIEAVRVPGAPPTGLVVFYRVGPDRYAYIVDFKQPIRSRSKYPSPPGDVSASNCVQLRSPFVSGFVSGKKDPTSSPQTPLPLIRVVPEPKAPAPSLCVKTGDLTASGPPAPAPSPCVETGDLTASDWFDRFSSVYPKKRGRLAAREAWNELGPPAALAERIVRAVRYMVRTREDWGKEYGRYVPRMDDFVRDRGWEEAWVDRGPRFAPGGGGAECSDCRRAMPAWRRGEPGRCRGCLEATGAPLTPAGAVTEA